MQLFTKSIYESRPTNDILAISVMSRHTLSNGWLPDPKIKPDAYHLWVPDLAPPDKLLRRWYQQPQGISPEEFTALYFTHLEQQPQKDTLDLLLELVLTTHRQPTLLCVEPTGQFCHRRLLAQRCAELEPRLQVVHQ